MTAGIHVNATGAAHGGCQLPEPRPATGRAASASCPAGFARYRTRRRIGCSRPRARLPMRTACVGTWSEPAGWPNPRRPPCGNDTLLEEARRGRLSIQTRPPAPRPGAIRSTAVSNPWPGLPRSPTPSCPSRCRIRTPARARRPVPLPPSNPAPRRARGAAS